MDQQAKEGHSAFQQYLTIHSVIAIQIFFPPSLFVLVISIFNFFKVVVFLSVSAYVEIFQKLP